MTTQERNKTVVHEFIQALFTKGDLSAVDRYLAEGFVAHDTPMPGATNDAAGFRETAMILRRAFPDWRSDVHLLIAEDDYVVERFTASGTHRGTFMGAAPTDCAATMPGINIFRLRDGKIAERWGNLDVHGSSPSSAWSHLHAVFDKFGIGSRRELVAVLTARPR